MISLYIDLGCQMSVFLDIFFESICLFWKESLWELLAFSELKQEKQTGTSQNCVWTFNLHTHASVFFLSKTELLLLNIYINEVLTLCQVREG